jgi:ABC-type transport system involved in multi-copper enzyme maturation permease subunit
MFTISGSGNIAPMVAGPDSRTVEQSLVGAFAGLIVVIVLGTIFITAEYRRGLIRTTLVASPRRGRVLAAKAIVLGCVTFVVGLAASAAAFALVGKIRRDNGERLYPASVPTEVRVVVGTAALLAVAAVLAMAVGTFLRKGAGAVTAVVVLVVLPYILAVASVLPVVPAQWLLRITPAAAFAIQQSTTEYFQVSTTYAPSTGYFPLAPWAGFGVLCGWTALALGVASVRLRRRDV